MTFSSYKVVLQDLARLDTGKRLMAMRLLCLEALMPLLQPLQCQYEEQLKREKVGVKADGIAWIEEAAKALEQELIKLEFLGEALVA